MENLEDDIEAQRTKGLKGSSGPMYMAQISLQLYLEDDSYGPEDKKKAREVYEWITKTRCESIDGVFRISPQYGIFLLDTLKTYEISENSDDQHILYYRYAVDSLQEQYDKYLKYEEFLQQMALATITDVNYRGYD